MDTGRRNRRSIVQLGISIGAIIVTGCLGGDDGDMNNSEGIMTDTNNNNNSTNDTENGTPGKLVPIGDIDTIYPKEGEYNIIIENAGREGREFSIQTKLDGEIIIDCTDELPADNAFVLTMDKAGTYTTTVESQSNRSTTTTVSDNNCNSRTIISFSNDGVVSRNENHC